MAMFQKEDPLIKSLGNKSPHSTFSSFFNKNNPKLSIPTQNKPITRTKSNSISTKAPLATIMTISSPKSPKKTSPSPTSRNNQNLLSERKPEIKKPSTLKETKKASLMNLRPKKYEAAQTVPVSEPPSADALDRYTFYSSNFSLFDAKSPTAKSPVDFPNGQSPSLAFSNTEKAYKETAQIELKTEPEEYIEEERVLVTSKSCKDYELAPDTKTAPTESTKASLGSPKTTKHTTGSPVAFGYTSKFTESFSSRIKPAQDRNYSPYLKTQQVPKSPTVNPNTGQTYYLPQKKSTPYEPNDMRILRSVSPTAGALEGTPKKDKITSYISKNPFLQPSSTDYGKYDKLFKGIQSRGLGKFMPEHYKKLGKSYTYENNSKTLRENRLLSSKSTLKGSRNMLGQYLSHREVQSFCEASNNNKTTPNEDNTNKGIQSEKLATEGDVAVHSGNFDNMSSGVRADTVTYTSVEQGGEPESPKKAKSGRQHSVRDSEVLDIMSSKRDSWVGKQHKETFEEFFSSAMGYMCEVIVSKEGKSSKYENRTHEEHLEVLLDHIISESLVLKKGIQELSERVRIGKSLLILLEMMLRSLVYLVRKDGTLKSTSRNRSNEKPVVRKEKSISSRQDYIVRFEDICGLSGKEGVCEENERNVRDNLCLEIQKRREELDTLEKELREGSQTRMLQYVQNIQVKVGKILRDKRR